MTTIDHSRARPAGDAKHRPAVRVIKDVVEPSASELALIVSGPDRTLHAIAIPGVVGEAALDEEIPPRFRPMAVRFEFSEKGPACTCVATTPRGPRRIELSVAAALTLVRAGVHGIVTGAFAEPFLPEPIAGSQST